MSIIRYSPFTEFDGFPAGLKVFQDTMNRLLAEPNGRPWVPAVDIKENENELLLTADIPGVDMKDVDVRVENGTLTIRGERKFESEKTGEKKDGSWHRVERSYGKFERAFTLPETVNFDAVKADYKDGVLKITLPKKEIAKPRQIKVAVNVN